MDFTLYLIIAVIVVAIWGLIIYIPIWLDERWADKHAQKYIKLKASLYDLPEYESSCIEETQLVNENNFRCGACGQGFCNSIVNGTCYHDITTEDSK